MIQPSEVYLVYLNVHESFQHLIGVVVDDVTYRKLVDRAEPYTRRYEEDLRTKTTLKDYKVRCEYTFEKNRRLILT